MSRKRVIRKASGSAPPRTRSSGGVAFVMSDNFNECCLQGYTSLNRCPEIVAAVRKIASLIGSMTIHLMSNTDDGDTRIVNELSRVIDIDPMPNMTRSTWMEGIVETMLLHGKGNAIVVPHTTDGYLGSLEPISASRVSFEPVGYRDYKVLIDGVAKSPKNLLHFVYNPDRFYLWKGTGVNVTLRDLAEKLKQASTTEKAFLSSEYKPSIIVKVDALVDEFASPEGRQKLLDSYVKPAVPGQPWLIPAEQFSVEQVRPLTLADLAIKDTVEINKRMVAALLDVPPFVVGVGEFKRDEWNVWIQTRIMAICKSIAAELTKKLILNPRWYLTFNVWSAMDYDLSTVSSTLLAGSDRGFVNGDEWRDRMHLNPAGLKEYKILENYIPYDMSGQQNKLTGGGT